MRVAALYDIHGNLPALDAVLIEVGRRDVDLVVVGGDIVWGGFPSETLERVRSLGDDATFIRGNADREVADPDQAGLEGPNAEINQWCADQLSDEQRSFLRNLPLRHACDIVGLGQTLFCHATPRSDAEIFTAETPDREVEEILGGFPEPILVCGHTHMQFDRLVAGKRVANAGSVGMPYADQPGAYWVLLGADGISFEQTPYDFERAAAAIAGSRLPHAAEFAADVPRPPSASEAIKHFESKRQR